VIAASAFKKVACRARQPVEARHWWASGSRCGQEEMPQVTLAPGGDPEYFPVGVKHRK